MDGKQFIRRIRKYARKQGLDVRVQSERGKGGHQTLYLGERHTVVQSGEIPKGTLAAMARQLGVDVEDI